LDNLVEGQKTAIFRCVFYFAFVGCTNLGRSLRKRSTLMETDIGHGTSVWLIVSGIVAHHFAALVYWLVA